jgi:hypothetical protein
MHGELSADPGPSSSALLQHLSQCRTNSDLLISDMRKTFAPRVDRSQLLLQVTTRYLLVGTCGSRFAGVAKFMPDKVIYAFEHPTERKVEMHMSYSDMLGVRMLSAPSTGTRIACAGELRFRIGKPLAYFSRDYDPNNETHDLRIGFESEADLSQLRLRVLPHVRALANG